MAALRLFAQVLPDHLAEFLLSPLTELMTHLGRARDLDVLLTEIANPVLFALPNEPRLAALASDITNRRYAARAQAIAMLSAPDYGRTLLTALELLHVSPADNPAMATLSSFASERLQRLRKKVRRLALGARNDDPASLHALRIGVKRLRYALEFFSPLEQKPALRRALKQLASMQDALGQLNDLANAGAMLMDCAGDDPRLREAVTLIGGWHGPRYARLLDNITRELARIARLRLPRLASV